MAAGGSSTVGRKVAILGAFGIALVGVLAIGLAWMGAHQDGRGTFCTAAGYRGGPTQPTPQEAFDQWWSEQRADGPSQDQTDIDRDGNTWDVEKGTPDWVRVVVGHERLDDGTRSKGWVVTGANGCSYTEA